MMKKKFKLTDLDCANCAAKMEQAIRKIDGVNDADWQADLLAKLLEGMPGHVNLIPLNDVEESPLKPSRRVAAFQKRLESHGVTVTVRRRLGGDIDASCGQLRRKAMKEGQPVQGESAGKPAGKR